MIEPREPGRGLECDPCEERTEKDFKIFWHSTTVDVFVSDRSSSLTNHRPALSFHDDSQVEAPKAHLDLLDLLHALVLEDAARGITATKC